MGDLEKGIYPINDTGPKVSDGYRVYRLKEKSLQLFISLTMTSTLVTYFTELKTERKLSMTNSASSIEALPDDIKGLRFVVNVVDYAKLPVDIYTRKNKQGKFIATYDDDIFSKSLSFFKFLENISFNEDTGKYLDPRVFPKEGYLAVIELLKYLIKDIILSYITILSNYPGELALDVLIGLPLLSRTMFLNEEVSEIGNILEREKAEGTVFFKNRINCCPRAVMVNGSQSTLTLDVLKDLFLKLIAEDKKLARRLDFSLVVRHIMDKSSPNYEVLRSLFMSLYSIYNFDIVLMEVPR